tara:strand:+ start:64 stop:579 length:516 start_codon:yes stop_codon:yes gene_type:complete
MDLTDDDIFNKSINNIVDEKPKAKRVLSDKQKENLKKGREKMALKRAKEREAKAKIKVESKGSKEHQNIKKENVKKKRATIKEINKKKEDEILQKLLKKDKVKNNRIDMFDKLKIKCLEKAKDVSEYNEIKVALDGINDDILGDNDKLKEYAKKVMSPYIKNVKPATKDEE